MSDRFSAPPGFRTRDKKREAAQQAVLTVMIVLFVIAPFLLTQSIIFLEPAGAIALLGLIGIFVVLLVPLHDRAVNMKPFFWGLVVFFALHVIWPRFLSIQVGSLPLISPIRITIVALLATWVFMVATAAAVHDELWRRLKAAPVITLGVLGIVVFEALAIPFSLAPGMSAKAFINNFVEFYMPFFVAVSLIRTRKNLQIVTRLIALLGIITAALLIAERITHVNVFTTYLGPFVNYDAAWLKTLMTDFRRLGTVGTYRARGPFYTPLSAAEYLVLTLPFIFYSAESTNSRWRRWGLIASVPLMLVGVWATDSRTSILASVAIVGLYGVVRGVMFLRAGGKSRIRPLVILAFVGFFAAVTVGFAIMFVGMDWQNALGPGGTRSIQIQMAIPKILSRPLIGYGPGMASYALGYSANGRTLTIDNYYLSMVLSAGLPGLFSFVTAFGAMVFLALRRMSTKPSERGLMLAFALMGIAFAMTRFTLSESENLSVCFIMLGAFVAAIRITSLSADAAAELEAEPSGKERRARRRTIVGSARWRRQVRLR